MPNGNDFREIAKKRLKTVLILMEAKDTGMATYMMGHSLECSLKAVICKHLRLQQYPGQTGRKNIDTYFMTHNFDQLLVVSGMSDILGPRGSEDAFRSWSDFTKEYQGEWVSMRYKLDDWSMQKITTLYTALNGIISEIKKRHKW